MKEEMAELELENTMVNRLPIDVFHQIFTLVLPTSHPSPVDNHLAPKFFATTEPYNTICVCRSWRNLVLSSPSLWTSFFLSFINPSDDTLKHVTRAIDQHLQRSHDLPLTMFLRLEGRYSVSLSQAIVSLLSSHQRRWRRVGIWFETNSGTPGLAPVPIPRIQLFIEDLAFLEELQLSFSTEYIITSSTGRSLCNALPSLTHIELLAPREPREGMRWIDLAPNLKELNLIYCADYNSDYKIEPSYPPSYENVGVIHQSHMTHLRLTNQTQLPVVSRGAKFMLDHMSCPALTEFHVDLGVGCNGRVLCDFLRRSMQAPGLEIFVLSLTSVLSRVPLVDPDTIFEALAYMPSLRTFRLRWTSHWSGMDAVLYALAARTSNPSTPTTSALAFNLNLLPALENLEFASTFIPSSPFIHLVTARWRAHNRTLKRVRLFRCVGMVEPFRSDDTFSEFDSKKDNLYRLPEYWRALKLSIEQGLHFVVENW